MKIKFILIISFYLSTFLLAQYNGGSGSGYGAGSSNLAQLSAFLQGPYSGGTMTTALNAIIPLSQPYNVSPWNYNGTESVASGFFSSHLNIVDWVLIELRATTASSSVEERRACFILNNGSIVDLDGSSPVVFDKTDGNSYYVVIRHRNHLAIMSANTLTLSSSLAGVYLTGGSSIYSFSSAQTQAYGTNPMNDLGTEFGMWMGDSDASGVIDVTDRANTWNLRNASGVYNGSDTDLSNVIDVSDRASTWNNRNRLTQVPN